MTPRNPSDEFQKHLETVLNPHDATPIIDADYHSNFYVPVLNDPIELQEVDFVIKNQVKSNKSAGLDGIGPGLFKCLPLQWVVVLTALFNVIFYTFYPIRWFFANLNMLFKKGNRMNGDHYRGISIIGTFAKIYDYVLYHRLMKWFQPDREQQAGAQPKRGCLEHIVTLRLYLIIVLSKRLNCLLY